MGLPGTIFLDLKYLTTWEGTSANTDFESAAELFCKTHKMFKVKIRIIINTTADSHNYIANRKWKILTILLDWDPKNLLLNLNLHFEIFQFEYHLRILVEFTFSKE